MVIYSGFTHWKWWFSIVMLVYQRVTPYNNQPNRVFLMASLDTNCPIHFWGQRDHQYEIHLVSIHIIHIIYILHISYISNIWYRFSVSVQLKPSTSIHQEHRRIFQFRTDPNLGKPPSSVALGSRFHQLRTSWDVLKMTGAGSLPSLGGEL